MDQRALPSILLVDDDPDVRQLATAALEEAGFAVAELPSGDKVLEQLAARPHVAVVLDLGLPGRHGLDVLRAIREQHSTPVIILTAESSETDRVVGLELGADDYVLKPFFPRELVARVRAVLRRGRLGEGEPGGDARLALGPLTVDQLAHEATLDEEVLDLTTKEFELLAFLAANPRQAFTRDQLLSHVWGSASEWQSPATVTEHVFRLRQKLAGSSHTWIATVRGVGYRFEPPAP